MSPELVVTERRWRWIEEREPVDPHENMARDSRLLDEMIVVDGLPAVRIYRWSTPAVTIGRLQDEDDVRAHFPGLTLVRRPTGGRAVLHGEDLTVSVATRDEWLPGTPGTVQASYQVIVSGIVEALRHNGIDAVVGERRSRRADPSCSSRAMSRAPGNGVDCFASVASCDISEASTGAKLVGSAQRRVGGAILQQMSIRGDVIGSVSLSTFVRDLRACMESTLKVDSWELVDTGSALMLY